MHFRVFVAAWSGAIFFGAGLVSWKKVLLSLLWTLNEPTIHFRMCKKIEEKKWFCVHLFIHFSLFSCKKITHGNKPSFSYQYHQRLPKKTLSIEPKKKVPVSIFFFLREPIKNSIISGHANMYFHGDKNYGCTWCIFLSFLDGFMLPRGQIDDAPNLVCGHAWPIYFLSLLLFHNSANKKRKYLMF